MWRERDAEARCGLVVVVVDVGSVPVRAGVPGPDGGVLIVVVLAALVPGAGLVHPVGQVGLQPLDTKHKHG